MSPSVNNLTFSQNQKIIFNLVPAKFEEKFSVVNIKKGEPARLSCNASGDPPLTVIWSKDNHQLNKKGTDK